ncbi:hypothetical protein quinque_008091 [Culex quinquefasciatus]
MLEEELEIALKVIVVGNGGVGKTSMVQRYCKGIYTKDYKKTIGVDFLERQIELDGEDIRIMLWDTAGQEEFDAITKAYYRGAQACVLTFIQNKIDLMDKAVVSFDEAESLAQSLGCRLIRTSVKEDVNVASVFRYLATKCHQQMKQQYSAAMPISQPTISAFSPTFQSKATSNTIQLTRPSVKRKPLQKRCGIF